jgi:hypothetical protein
LVRCVAAVSRYRDPETKIDLRIPETEIWENKVESKGELYRTNNLDSRKKRQEIKNLVF